MGRRNTKEVRLSKLSQRALQRLTQNKQRSDRRYDSKDWASKMFNKLNKGEEENENGTDQN